MIRAVLIEGSSRRRTAMQCVTFLPLVYLADQETTHSAGTPRHHGRGNVSHPPGALETNINEGRQVPADCQDYLWRRVTCVSARACELSVRV